MKLLIACDSFKGTLSSHEIGTIISNNLYSISPQIEVEVVPLADGGEGTLTCLTNQDSIFHEINVCGVNQVRVKAKIAFDKDTAIIEMAQANGITLSKILDPFSAATTGCGELIQYALNQGYRKFIIGLGGSATNDLGLSMLECLGIRFYSNHEIIHPLLMNFEKIDAIDFSNFDSRIHESEFIIASDVKNPLTGTQGATAIFGPQKGLRKDEIDFVDSQLLRLAKLLCSSLSIPFTEEPGDGAAGGLGFTFRNCFNAQMKHGIGLISDILHLEDKIKKADLIITGEGKMDLQTLQGKAPYGVLTLAKKHNKKIIGLCGCVENKEELLNAGFDAIYPLVDEVTTFTSATTNPLEVIEKRLQQIMEDLKHE
ncbi:glycerate kinase [Anaerorhabdus sp.]|uniref:glycerate kinase n=1 Tax=Anaerorhabdus sp. TaxID=1872524 RepID=UPI002FCA7BB6